MLDLNSWRVLKTNALSPDKLGPDDIISFGIKPSMFTPTLKETGSLRGRATKSQFYGKGVTAALKCKVRFEDSLLSLVSVLVSQTAEPTSQGGLGGRWRVRVAASRGAGLDCGVERPKRAPPASPPLG